MEARSNLAFHFIARKHQKRKGSAEEEENEEKSRLAEVKMCFVHE